jgi:cullin 3
MNSSGYQIVLHKHGEMLYNGVKNTLSNYIQGVREKIMECKDEVFLKQLLAQWEKHRTSVSMVRDILMYMVCVCVLGLCVSIINSLYYTLIG